MRSARRLAAGLGLGLLVGVPLAVPSFADLQTQPQVEFTGDVGVPCGSHPDRSSVTVKPETRVVFVNSIGQGARMRIDGQDGDPVADGQAVEMQFRRGPVSIAMIPDCALVPGTEGSYQPVTIDVNPVLPSSSGAPATKGPARPRPTRTPAVPPSTDPNRTVDGGRSLPLATASADANESLVPAPAVEGSPPAGTPTVGLGGDTPTNTGLIGLLVLIATVCIVGVSFGAIRLIGSERAIRSEFA